MYVRFRRCHRNVIWPLIQQSVVLKDLTRGHVFVNIHSNSTYIFKKYILYGEKVSRGENFARSKNLFFYRTPLGDYFFIFY